MVERRSENIEIVKKKSLYKGFFEMDEYFLKYPRYDGGMSRVISREVMERRHAVGVLLYDAVKDTVVLVEQFRVGVYLTGEYPWVVECVAGIIEPGEEPAEVAVREAREESGCDVLDLIPIIKYFSSPGGMTETIQLFCGRIDSERHGTLGGLESEAEDIRVLVMPSDEAVRALKDGKINNAVTVIALQWFMLNKDMLKERWG